MEEGSLFSTPSPAFIKALIFIHEQWADPEYSVLSRGAAHLDLHLKASSRDTIKNGLKRCVHAGRRTQLEGYLEMMKWIG